MNEFLVGMFSATFWRSISGPPFLFFGGGFRVYFGCFVVIVGIVVILGGFSPLVLFWM